MCPDHNDISVRNTRLVQVVCEQIGSFVDLAVSKSPLRRCRRPRLDNAWSVWGGFRRGPETFMNGTGKAGPVEVDGRIWESTHDECAFVKFGLYGRIPEQRDKLMGLKIYDALPKEEL